MSVDTDATAGPDTATAQLAWKLDAAVSAELGVDLNPGVKALIPPGDLDTMRRTLFQRKATLLGGTVGP